ncbi:pentatricopeptide repeat-containing protein At4g16390, chloroplastic-like [Cicer arietinum]|uniref:Pentatricopeptide repeat-containing protein At4g16390, chloroplastic-like n=1 Tax=Cicer arietinum TaxID=3827 RepID=A0A1S3E106_CICAR|nr:pentatricopeptide repeat-containing protein At4g16390, chloroplastic-like [Cicer arietinum]
MAQAYPLCSSPFSYALSDLTIRISSHYSFINYKLPNFHHTSRKFDTFFSFQPLNSLQHENQNPDTKSSTLSKTKKWVNPKTLQAKRIWKKSYAVVSSLAKLPKSIHEQQVSEVLDALGDNVTDRDAEFILHNIANPKTAILALKYFQLKIQIEPERHVVFYNVVFKLFREVKDFANAEQLFDEMLQRGVKPDILTFSTLIRCAAVCSLPHKAVELFERMPSFGCEPDHNVASSMIYVYARTGNVDMALQLYDRAKNEKWLVRTVAFSSLIKMHGMLGNYDGCLNVYNDMKVLGVRPNMVMYNALLYAMGRAKRGRDAKGIYQEMRNNGFSPNWATYSALLEAYSRARLSKEALSVYKEMKEKGMTMNKVLYGMLLDMCADVGYAEEAVELFEEMKRSETCQPDNFIYSSLINMYSCSGNVLEAEAMLNEMISRGLEPNILVLTMFVHCYGKAKRPDDVVNIFNRFWDLGITPDDRLCDCLLYVMTQIPKEEFGKITNCIEKANPKLSYVVTHLIEEREGDGDFRKEASELLSSANDDVKKSMCNSLIDLCVNLGLQDRACKLLDLGSTLEIYSDIQSRTENKWCLNLKKLSVGAAMTALHVWIDDLSKAFESGEEVPRVLGICTVSWRHKRSDKDLASVFESYLKELGAPFHKATNMVGWFFTTNQEAKSWLHSRDSTETLAALNSTGLVVPTEALHH